MALRARRREARSDVWPAFVDVLSNLLLVFIFLGQYFMRGLLAGSLKG